MGKNKKHLFPGHLMALFSVIVWGTTFITTKSLLNNFTPLEILLYRFFIGYIMLCIFAPHPLRFMGLKNEILLFLAGASGVTIYFLCENTALSYTYASNVSIIVSTAPIFTGLFALLFRGEKLRSTFIIGFFVAISGIVLVTYSNGNADIHISPVGDLLALGGAVCWGIYSITTTAVRHSEKESLHVTRRIFFYGLLSMLPLLIWKKPTFHIITYHPVNDVLKLVFLGIVASALCYITWNRSMGILGATRTSVYIYLIPIVTLVFSYFMLGEKLTFYSGIGCFLVLLGLFLSERKKG